jgi:hypothetical protein
VALSHLKISNRAWLVTTILAFAFGTQLGNHASNQSLAEENFGMDNRQFTREETMLLNMMHSKGSVGYFILESLRLSKDSTRDLEKALFQLREIEKTYAKSKGQPDTRYLSGTELKMVHAKQISEDLEHCASDCFQDLKASIKESLMQTAIKPLKTEK